MQTLTPASQPAAVASRPVPIAVARGRGRGRGRGRQVISNAEAEVADNPATSDHAEPPAVIARRPHTHACDGAQTETEPDAAPKTRATRTRKK